MWQIQARLKTGKEWEPISVELRGASGERQYHYDSPAECEAALERYLSIEHSFPGLIVSLAVGRTFLLAKYDLRLVQIISLPSIDLKRHAGVGLESPGGSKLEHPEAPQ